MDKKNYDDTEIEEQELHYHKKTLFQQMTYIRYMINIWLYIDIHIHDYIQMITYIYYIYIYIYNIILLLSSFYNVANFFPNFNIFIKKIFMVYPQIHTFSFIKVFSMIIYRKDFDKSKCMYFWIKDENFFDKYIEICERVSHIIKRK